MRNGEREWRTRYFSYGYVRIVETLKPHYGDKAYKIFFTEFYNTSFPSVSL